MSVLKELLNVYWLRPESALWRSIDIEVMKDFEICGNSLDLGCGDGVFSYIRGGGKFDISFDDYQSIGNLEKYYDNEDIHDVFLEGYSPKINRKPNYLFSTALDHKKNLLLKAKKLNFHQDYILHDANKDLPFEDHTFDSIFSNILYWLDDIQKSINEISRVLKTGGQVALMLPNKTMSEFSFYNNLYVKTQDIRYKFLEKLDRGRNSSNIKVSKSYKEWRSIFDNSGLKVLEHKTHLSKTTIQIWDVGLRPIFPVIYKLVNAVDDSDKLITVKKEWIELFMNYLKPLYDLELSGLIDQGVEKGFHYFVLEK